MNRSTKTPLCLTAFVVTFLLLGRECFLRYGPELAINFTESVPRGIYRLSPVTKIERGMYVALKPPDIALWIASGRPWFRADRIFIKEVAGLAGDIICTVNDRLTINGLDRGPVFETDRQGAPLPHFHGCYSVSPDELYLLGPNSVWTFDSRYFGAVKHSEIDRKAVRYAGFDRFLIHILGGIR